MEKILLLLKDRDNCQLLTEWLKDKYQIYDTGDDLMSKAFDLCIIDEPEFDDLQEQIQRRKRSEAPSFFPVLFVTNPYGADRAARYLWKTIDEMILAPVRRIELHARVENLLKVRRQSTHLVSKDKEMIADSRERLQLAVKAAGIGLWDWDISTNKVYYSSEWKHQIGYEDYEISDEFGEWERRVHPDDIERMKAAINSYLSNPTRSYREEFRLRHRNGSYMWILSQASLIYDDQRTPLRMLGCHIDITSRKKMEEKLRYKEYLLSESQRVAHIGSWDRDLVANKIIWTEEMYRIRGVSKEHFPLTFENFFKIIYSEDLPVMQKWLETVISGINPGDLEFRIVLPDQTIKWVRGAGELFLDENGKTVRIIGTEQDITGRKKIAEALRESEARLRRFLESFGGLAYQVDTVKPNVAFMYGNVKTFTGYSLEEFIAGDLNWQNFVHKEDLNSMLHEKNMLLADHAYVADYDYRIVNRDGSVRWVRDTAWWNEKENSPMLLNGIVIDTTGRHVAQERIQKLTRAYEMLSNVNQTIVRTRDLQELFDSTCSIAVHKGYFNNAWIALVDGKISIIAQAGLKPEMIRKLTDVLNSHHGKKLDLICELLKREHAVISESGARKEPFNWQDIFLLSNKSVAAFPLLVDGEVKGVFGLSAGETGFFDKEETGLLHELALDLAFAMEFRKTEEKLRINEERMRLSLKASKQGYFDADPQNGTILISSEITQMLGFSPVERLMSFDELFETIHPEDRIKVKKAYDVNHHKEFRVEFRQKDISGNWEWTLSVGKVTEWNTQGNPVRIMGIHADISSRKIAEEKLTENMVELAKKVSELRSINRKLDSANSKLKQIDRVKTDFVSAASHEIRTPLTSILGFAQTLLATDLEIPPQSRIKYLRIIESEAMRLSRLADSLLDISRIETRRTELKKKQFAIIDLVRDVLHSIKVPDNLKVEIHTCNENLLVNGDWERLGQVIRNILDNSFRYSQPNSTVKIDICNWDTAVTIGITDTGPGLPQSEYENIFDKFYRIKGEKNPSRGSGLGLAIAKEIIVAHHGKIWVESKKGMGSTFFVSIPAV